MNIAILARYIHNTYKDMVSIHDCVADAMFSILMIKVKQCTIYIILLSRGIKMSEISDVALSLACPYIIISYERSCDGRWRDIIDTIISHHI